MGFYDHFIASINNVVFGKKEEKTEGLKYLLKLGVGWAAGMIAAVLVLSALFESKIYLVSSLFIGFILEMCIRDSASARITTQRY